MRSRAQLAYESATLDDLPAGFADLAARVARAEVARGAGRVDFPEQEIERDDDGGYELRFRPRTWSEEWNATMSLVTNLAVAELMPAHGTGLFRVMPGVDEHGERRLRHTARAFDLEWPDGQSLAEFQRTLPHDDPRTAAFLLAVRRAGGGASYSRAAPGERPWHAAMATTYAHATAPLLHKNPPYHPMKDFVPITLLVTSPTLIAASNKAGFTSVKALVDAAKANPGKLSYASGGPGSAPHLATELFNSIAGIELLQVPYKGGGESVPALMAGEIDAHFFAVATAMLAADSMRALQNRWRRRG